MNIIRHSYFGLAVLAAALTAGPAQAWNMGPAMGGGAAGAAASGAAAAAAAAAAASAAAAGRAANAGVYGARSGAGGGGGGGYGSGGGGGGGYGGGGYGGSGGGGGDDPTIAGATDDLQQALLDPTVQVLGAGLMPGGSNAGNGGGDSPPAPPPATTAVASAGGGNTLDPNVQDYLNMYKSGLVTLQDIADLVQNGTIPLEKLPPALQLLITPLLSGGGGSPPSTPTATSGPTGGGGTGSSGYAQGGGILAAIIATQPDPANLPGLQQQLAQAQDAYNRAIDALTAEQNFSQMVWNTRFNGPGDWSPLSPGNVDTVMTQGQNGAHGVDGLPPGASENEIWQHWVYSVEPAHINELVQVVDKAAATLQAVQAALDAY